MIVHNSTGGLSWPFASLLLALFVWSPYTCAEQADRLSDEINNTVLEQRLKFIEKRLVRQGPDARYWQHGWTGFHAASAVVQGVLAVDADDSDDEVNYLVGAVKSTGALAQMLIRPLPAVQSATRFQALPSRSREELIHKVAQGEALLHENADRSSDAVTSTLLGIAVSETNIWTEPSRAINDLEDYQNNKWAQRETSEVSWRIVPLARRVEVNIRF